MNRILLIEDEATLSLLLRERLEKEGYSVAACKDGEQGLAEALREAYDLLLLDIQVKGLKTGADDYLIKPFEVAELLARMEALLRRANNSPPQLIDSLFCFGNVVVNFRKQEVLREGSPVELTAREFELLRYFVSHPDELISRDALLKQVWGYQQGLPNTRTVDVHVAQLRQKLELNPKSPRHILTAHRSGYKFIPFP